MSTLAKSRRAGTGAVSAIGRRQLLAGTTGGLLALLIADQSSATPRDAAQKLEEWTGVAKPEKGRVTVEMPEITDQGPLVPIRVTVDSPMTADDHVKAIHIVAERNTVPEVASFYLSPANGVARVATRMRVKETQIVVAAAVMSDGSVYMGRARCRVVGGAGGCG